MDKKMDLTCTLVIKVNQKLPNAKVQMELTIKNVSSATLILNTRFSVVPVYGDIRPKVILDRTELPFKYRVKIRRVREDDFVRLEPSSVRVVKYDLESGFNFRQSGSYKIVVTYVNSESPLHLVGPPVFKGSVESNEVDFDV